MIAVSKRRGWAVPALVVLVALLVLVMALGGVALGGTTTTLPAATTTLVPSVSTTSSTAPASLNTIASGLSQAPTLSAAAAILIDADSGRVIYSRNADAQRQIASTTKIMTCLIALESLPLDKVVTASKLAESTNESQLGVKAGQKFTVQQMLYALMVHSANDAGVVLAEASAGSVDAFVQQMNDKAAALGLKNTHFTNPHGLDTVGYKAGYSSARDLATLAQYAMKNQEFRALVGTVNWSITMPGNTKVQNFRNHNELLGAVSWVTGVKTGYTSKAGFCLVGSGKQNGASLISVILGEKTQAPCWSDSKKLLQYGFSRYQKVTLAQEGVPMAQVALPYRMDEKLPLVTESSLQATVFSGDAAEGKVTVQPNLVLPVEAGQVYGKVQFTVSGRVVGSVNLVAARSVEKVTLGLKLAYFWHRLTKWVGG
jgi:serine-type D-Ala-D-Ala carboxypeptidase (penicillin-binding protein 5/6)